MRIDIHSCTRLGGAHERNQDRALVGADVLESTDGVHHITGEAPMLLGVFDGLGGHPAGDVASELAARVVVEAGPPRDEAEMRALLLDADDAIQHAMRREPEHLGMGTTAALLVLGGDPPVALAANVGDSTVWRLARRELEELSVSDRWDVGGGVLQCLGANDQPINPHLRSIPVGPGDRLLLASDGLTDVVSRQGLRAALDDDSGAAVEALAAIVEQAGMPDDLTIVLADLLR